MTPTKKYAKGLFTLMLAVLLLLPAATPPVSAAGSQSYVLAQIVEAAADGYSYVQWRRT